MAIACQPQGTATKLLLMIWPCPSRKKLRVKTAVQGGEGGTVKDAPAQQDVGAPSDISPYPANGNRIPSPSEDSMVP